MEDLMEPGDWQQLKDEFGTLVEDAAAIERLIDHAFTFIAQGRIDLAKDKLTSARESAAHAYENAKRSYETISTG